MIAVTTEIEKGIDLEKRELIARMTEALARSGRTQAEVARLLGVTAQAVSGWFSTGTISKPNLVKFGAITGASMKELMAKEPLTAQVAEPSQKYVYVAKYQAIAGLGPGRHNEPHVEISGTHAYRREFIERHGWNPERLAVIEAEGPSMAPTINDGDVVLVHLDETRIKSGEVYAIEDPDQGTRIKRLHRTLDGRIRVASDNEDKRLYPDDFLTPDSGARVVGRVVHRSGAV